MSDKQTAVGTLDGITEKPTGWTTIEVALPGKQYPLKLDTKIQEFIELARAAGTNVMEWTYSESDSGTPNPNKPGSNYINRRFEGVAPVSAETQAAATATPSAPEGRYSDDEIARFEAKERRDYRSRAWAQTLGAFTHTIKVDDDPKEVFTRLQAFQRLVFQDVCQSFAYPEDESDVPF